MNRRTLLSTVALVVAGGCAGSGSTEPQVTAETAGGNGRPVEANDALAVQSKELTEGRDGYPLVRGVVKNVATEPLVDARVRVSVEVEAAAIPRELHRDRMEPEETWAWSVLFDDEVLVPEAITGWQVVTFAEYAD